MEPLVASPVAPVQPYAAVAQPPTGGASTGVALAAHHPAKRTNSLVGFPMDASTAASSTQSSFAWQKDRALSSQLSMQFSNNDSMLSSNITTTCSSFAIGLPSAASPVALIPTIAVLSSAGMPPSPSHSTSTPGGLVSAVRSQTSASATPLRSLDAAVSGESVDTAAETGEELGTTKPFVDLGKEAREVADGSTQLDVAAELTPAETQCPPAAIAEHDSKSHGKSSRPRAFTESRVVSGKRVAAAAQEADGADLRAVASAPFSPAAAVASDLAGLRRVPVAVRVGVERGRTSLAPPPPIPAFGTPTNPKGSATYEQPGRCPTDAALSAVECLLPLLQQASEEVCRLCDEICLGSKRRCDACLKASSPLARGDSSGRSPSSRSVSTGANASGMHGAASTAPTQTSHGQLSQAVSPSGVGISSSLPGCGGSFGNSNSGLQRAHPRTTSVEFLPDEAVLLCGGGGGGSAFARSPSASRGDAGSRSSSCVAVAAEPPEVASSRPTVRSCEPQLPSRQGLGDDRGAAPSLAFQTVELVKALAEVVVAAAECPPGGIPPPPPPPPAQLLHGCGLTGAIGTVDGSSYLRRGMAWAMDPCAQPWPMKSTTHWPLQYGAPPAFLAPHLAVGFPPAWFPSAPDAYRFGSFSASATALPSPTVLPQSAVGTSPWSSLAHPTPWTCGSWPSPAPRNVPRAAGAASISVGGSAVCSPGAPTAAEQKIFSTAAQYFITSLAWRFEAELEASENWWAHHSRAPPSAETCSGGLEGSCHEEPQPRSTPLHASLLQDGPTALAGNSRTRTSLSSLRLLGLRKPIAHTAPGSLTSEITSRPHAATPDLAVVQMLSRRVWQLELEFAALRSAQASHGKIVQCAEEFEQCMRTRRELGAQKATVYESLESGGGLVGPMTDKLRELDGSGETLTLQMQALADAMQVLSQVARPAQQDGGETAHPLPPPSILSTADWDSSCLHPAAAAAAGLLRPSSVARAAVFAEEWHRICTPFVLRQYCPPLSPPERNAKTPSSSLAATLPCGCAMVVFVFPEAQRTPASLMLRFVENIREARGLAQPLHFVSQSHSYGAVWVPLDEALAWSHLVLQLHLQRCSPSTLPFADLLRTMRTYIFLPSLLMTTGTTAPPPSTDETPQVQPSNTSGGGEGGAPVLVPATSSAAPEPHHRLIPLPQQVQPKSVNQYWQMHLCTRGAHGGNAPLEVLAMGIGRLVGVLPHYMEVVTTPTKSLNVWVPLRGRDAWMAWTTHVRSAVDAQGVLLATTTAGQDPQQAASQQQEELVVGNHHSNAHSSVMRHWPGFEEVVLARKRNRTRCSANRNSVSDPPKNPPQMS